MSRFKISINLLHYFQDHRQLVKMFINDDMKIVKDLENRIVELFNIERSFYLMCQNHYLPSVEDIRLLNENDTVYVIPNFDETSIEKKKSKKAKTKIDTQEKAGEIVNGKDSSAILTEIVKNRKERKKEKKISLLSPLDTDLEARNENVKKLCKNEKLIKQKTVLPTADNNTRATKVEIPDAQSNKIDSKLIEPSTSDSSKLTKNSYDPLEIVEVTSPKLNGSNKKKSLVQTIEILSTKQQEKCLEQINTNSSKRKYFSLNEVIEFGEKSSRSPVKDANNLEHSRDLNVITRTDNKSNDGIKFRKYAQERSIGHLLKSLNNQSENQVEDSEKYEDVSKEFVTKRRRVRTRKRKRVNDSESTDNVFDSTTEFRSPRTRAAPISHVKFSDAEFETNTESKGNKCEISMNENQINNFNEIAKVNHFNVEPNFVHSTPQHKFSMNEVHKTNGENYSQNKNVTSDAMEENYYQHVTRRQNRCNLINKINPAMHPLLTDAPAVNNVILFKKLKVGEDYTPQISEYILAEVRDISKDGNLLSVVVLDGHKELEEPRGKFSCVLEEDKDYSETVYIERNSLLDARILKPGSL